MRKIRYVGSAIRSLYDPKQEFPHRDGSPALAE
jgi:hypothetical protein